MLVSDSNGKMTLKPESHGIRRDRYTTKAAIDDVPTVREPNEVKDILFQVGLNDLRRGFSPDEIQEQRFENANAVQPTFPKRQTTCHSTSAS